LNASAASIRIWFGEGSLIWGDGEDEDRVRSVRSRGSLRKFTDRARERGIVLRKIRWTNRRGEENNAAVHLQGGDSELEYITKGEEERAGTRYFGERNPLGCRRRSIRKDETAGGAQLACRPENDRKKRIYLAMAIAMAGYSNSWRPLSWEKSTDSKRFLVSLGSMAERIDLKKKRGQVRSPTGLSQTYPEEKVSLARRERSSARMEEQGRIAFNWGRRSAFFLPEAFGKEGFCNRGGRAAFQKARPRCTKKDV